MFPDARIKLRTSNLVIAIQLFNEVTENNDRPKIKNIRN